MKNTQQLLRHLGLWLTFVILSFALISTPAKAAKKDIIYEYETITQKKGTSFSSALKKASLSAYQTRLIKAIPIRHEAISDRKLRFIYVIKNKKRLLKEFRVTRGKHTANYVLTGTVGNHRFVSKRSQIPSRKLQRRTRLVSNVSKNTRSSAANNKQKTTAVIHGKRLTGMTVTQRKGQSLDSAWAPLRLTRLQRQIMQSGDYLKSAKSTRQFTLYFETKGLSKLLRAVRVSRAGKQVDYVVKSSGKRFKLINLKTLKASESRAVKKQLAAARVVSLRGRSPAVVKHNNSAKQSRGRSSKVTLKNSGGYQAVSVTQRAGQSLAAAIRQAKLTTVQRRLVLAMPARATAKSARNIHLLFKGSGKKRRLKALRIVRGRQAAEYVLISYKGKLTWADSKGRIKSNAGFRRYPVNFSHVSSRFNLRRRHPITRRIRPHTGIDLKAPHGTPVYAPANGIVSFAGRQRGYGITLVIDHQNGYKTKYAHLSAITRGLRKGKYVSKGKRIARVGNTGLSTGSHLHYEIIVNGRVRNPATVRLPGGRGGSKTVPAAKVAANTYLPKLRRMTR